MAEQNYITDKLKETDFFHEVDDSDVNDLLKNIKSQKYSKKEFIFHAGEKTQNLFMILKGHVRLFKSTSDGKEVNLHLYGPGQTFGEVPLFINIGYPASAAAESDAEILAIPKTYLIEKIKTKPEIAFKIIGSLSKKLNEFSSLIQSLALSKGQNKVAVYLLDLHKKFGKSFSLPFKKVQIAHNLAITPETFSREMAKLRKGGIISYKNKIIKINDIDKLISIAAI